MNATLAHLLALTDVLSAKTASEDDPNGQQCHGKRNNSED